MSFSGIGDKHYRMLSSSGLEPRYMRNARKAKAKAKIEAREPLAKVALNRAISVKRQLKAQAEVRFKDSYATSSASSAGSIILLNGTTVGDSNGQREGDNILIKSVRVNGHFIGADATNIIRVMLVIDKQPNQATFNLTDLLDTTSSEAVHAYRQTTSRDRFTVLYDRKWSTVGSSGTNPNDSTLRLYKFSKRLNLKSWYFGSAGTVADLKTNALYLVFMSDSGAVTHPTFVYNARVKFVA